MRSYFCNFCNFCGTKRLWNNVVAAGLISRNETKSWNRKAVGRVCLCGEWTVVFSFCPAEIAEIAEIF